MFHKVNQGRDVVSFRCRVCVALAKNAGIEGFQCCAVEAQVVFKEVVKGGVRIKLKTVGLHKQVAQCLLGTGDEKLRVAFLLLPNADREIRYRTR